MRALELRTGSLRLDGDGVRSEHGRQILSGLVDTGEEQREAARHAVDVMFESGCVVAGGDKDRSIDVLAYEYLKDNHEDKIVLTWSRRDVEAVTQAIRTQLDNDQTTGRAEFAVAGEGPLQGFLPAFRHFVRSLDTQLCHVTNAQQLRQVSLNKDGTDSKSEP